MVASDSELRKKVTAQLGWDSRLDASDIKVEVSNKKATLSGTVGTLVEKRLAEKDTRMMPHVKTVENLLQVKYPPDMPGITDKEIKESVLFVLNHSSDIRAKHIQVSVFKGIVTLEGVVRSFWEKTKAEDIAASIIGVLGIKNNLIVALPETVPDDIIKEDILEALKRTYALDIDTLKINVLRGVVTLTGTVPTWDLYFDVEDTAKYTHGVINVKNQLSVE